MVARKAVGFFHGDEGYNCCQAVIKAFQDKGEITEDQIAECKAFGGGRAEDGRCGALHAIKCMVKNDDLFGEIEEKFVEKATTPRCREIKKAGTLNCKECVGLAAGLLDELGTDAEIGFELK